MAKRGNEEGPSLVKKPRISKYYGDEELSDVILQVGNEDIHAHKMVLAVMSPHFKELFLKDETKEKTFIIDEVPSVFTFILDAIYNDQKNISYDQCEGVTADTDNHEDEQYDKLWELIDQKWQFHTKMMNVAEKYQVTPYVLARIVNQHLSTRCSSFKCVVCTTGALIAVNYNMPHIEGNVKRCSKCYSLCLRRIGKTCKTFNISVSAMLMILHPFQGFPQGDEEASANNGDNVANREEEKRLTIVEYGDSSLSDVTLIIENYEFKVHKLMLANKSSDYFRTMHFGEFHEQTKARTPIKADGEAFKFLLELIYNSDFAQPEFLECRAGESLKRARDRVREFWKIMPNLMASLEFFNFPIQLVETSLLLHYCRSNTCTVCANKKIFAIMYKLETIKAKIESTSETIDSSLERYLTCFPEQLSFDSEDLADLINFLNQES